MSDQRLVMWRAGVVVVAFVLGVALGGCAPSTDAAEYELAFQHYGEPSLLLVSGEGEEAGSVAVFAETRVEVAPREWEWEGEKIGVFPLEELGTVIDRPDLREATLARMIAISGRATTDPIKSFLDSRGWYPIGPVGDGTVLWKRDR